MRGSTFEAFLDELAKVGEAAERKNATWPKARRALGYALLGGVATGLGGATGNLVGRALMPRILPKASPATLNFIAGIGTGLASAGALAGAAAMARYKRKVEGEEDE